jgi:hypothetical protein
LQACGARDERPAQYSKIYPSGVFTKNPSVGSQYKVMRKKVMAKMMMGQIDHARSRVRTIKAELCGKPPEPLKTYRVNDLVAGLQNGEVAFTGPQLQRLAQQWANQYVKDARSAYGKINFETIVLDAAFAQEREVDKKRFEAENEKASAVEDAIVLGDQHAALAALQDFAAFKP